MTTKTKPVAAVKKEVTKFSADQLRAIYTAAVVAGLIARGAGSSADTIARTAAQYVDALMGDER